MPVEGVKGGNALWLLLAVFKLDVIGLMPSVEPLLGGVNRLPTLVSVVAGAACVELKLGCC